MAPAPTTVGANECAVRGWHCRVVSSRAVHACGGWATCMALLQTCLCMSHSTRICPRKCASAPRISLLHFRRATSRLSGRPFTVHPIRHTHVIHCMAERRGLTARLSMNNMPVLQGQSERGSTAGNMNAAHEQHGPVRACHCHAPRAHTGNPVTSSPLARLRLQVLRGRCCDSNLPCVYTTTCVCVWCVYGVRAVPAWQVVSPCGASKGQLSLLLATAVGSSRSHHVCMCPVTCHQATLVAPVRLLYACLASVSDVVCLLPLLCWLPCSGAAAGLGQPRSRGLNVRQPAINPDAGVSLLESLKYADI